MSLLGHFRENFFVKYNYVLYYRYYEHQKAGLPLPDMFYYSIMNKISLETLYFIKYPLTIFFSFLFFVSGILFFRALKKNLIRYFVFMYGVLFSVSGIMVIAGVILYGKWDSFLYYLSRKLMGLEQSPVPALMIFAASALIEQKFKPDTSPSKTNP